MPEAKAQGVDPNMPISLYDYFQDTIGQQDQENTGALQRKLRGKKTTGDEMRHLDLRETLSAEGRPLGNVDESKRFKGVPGGQLPSFLNDVEEGNSMWASAHPEVGGYYGIGGIEKNRDSKKIKNWGNKSEGFLFELSDDIRDSRTTPHIAEDPFEDRQSWQSALETAMQEGEDPQQFPDKLRTFEAVVQPEGSFSDVVEEARMVSDNGVSEPKSLDLIKQIGNQTEYDSPKELLMQDNLNVEGYGIAGSTSAQNVEDGLSRGNFVDMSGGFNSVDSTAKDLAETAGSMFKKVSHLT